MYVIRLDDVLSGRDYPDAGNALYDLILTHKDKDKIVIDLEGISSLPSMFLNVSIGRYVEEFGIESLKKTISFRKITKQQADRIVKYLSEIKEKSLA